MKILVSTILCTFVLFTIVGDLEAGDIIGKVELISSPTTSQTPHSPFARERSSESVELHSPTEENKLISIVFLGQHPDLKPIIDPLYKPVVDQINMEIIPHVLAIQVGTTVNFVNSDNIYHNIFSLSPTRKFDLGRYGMGGRKDITFEKPGEVRVFCDIHPHMNSVVLVLPNRYFAEVYSDGDFAIKNVPEGTYKLHAWHEVFPEVVRSLNVPETGEVEVVFTLGNR